MRPLFTIHAGEFLVGDYIKRRLSARFDVWVPGQDTGIDLLVTRKRRAPSAARPIALQIKFSRSFPGGPRAPSRLASGWFKLTPSKILSSRADVWVFVVLDLRQRAYFVLIPTRELRRRIPRARPPVWHLYLTFYKGRTCIDTRDLSPREHPTPPDYAVKDARRDYSDYVENWSILSRSGR